jgi:D-glycero-beta-D-manno-heptose-7-phosphate kinase
MEADLRGLLDRLGGKRVLVVGDLYLDHYIFGSPNGISREAPVMVLNEQRREDQLGGGAAPALALRKLGYDVAVAGVVGDDPEGQRVLDLLTGAGIDATRVLVDPTRPTTAKIRVVAEGFLLFPQQILRVDRQDRDAIPANVERALSHAIRTYQADAIVASDYRSGVLSEVVVDAIRREQQVQGALATVDSQGELSKFHGFDLVKCNQAEAEAVLGHTISDAAARERLLSGLRADLSCRCLVVTRGGDGATVVTDGAHEDVPSANRTEIFDVTGAGDTVVAVMTAALLANASPVEAASLAQIAAGVVVRRWGNAQASRDEISDLVESMAG